MSKYSKRLRGVHGLVINALERDATEGRPARGEMAAELKLAIAEQYDSQLVQEQAQVAMIGPAQVWHIQDERRPDFYTPEKTEVLMVVATLDDRIRVTPLHALQPVIQCDTCKDTGCQLGEAFELTPCPECSTNQQVQAPAVTALIESLKETLAIVEGLDSNIHADVIQNSKLALAGFNVAAARQITTRRTP